MLHSYFLKQMKEAWNETVHRSSNIVITYYDKYTKQKIHPSLRASSAGRRILSKQTVHPGPFASGPGQETRRGPARLAGAPSGTMHPATHPICAGCFGLFQQTGQCCQFEQIGTSKN
jgi:hypothetical protein